jgi:hypothetical protein
VLALGQLAQIAPELALARALVPDVTASSFR